MKLNKNEYEHMVDFHAFTPSLKVLRYIASYIGVLSVEDSIEFLEDCGIPSEQIKTANDSRKILYHVMKELANSNEKADHTLLIKIISDSINPALYEKANVSEEDIVARYNIWLHRENLQVYELEHGDYSITTYIPVSTNMENMEYEEAEYELSILKSVLQPYIEKITETTIAYRLLLQLVDVFSQRSFPVDQQLNEYYLGLFAFIESNITTIQAEVATVYETENPFDAPPSNYIHPDIYNNAYGKSVLYKPFTNLYLAEKEMEQQNKSWENIKKQMNTCFGLFDSINRKFEANNIVVLPNKKLWAEVKNYLKQAIKIDYNEFFGFEGTKFWLKRVAAENLVISFHPKKQGITDPLCLLYAFVDCLKKHGSYNTGRLSAVLSRSDAVAYIKANFPNIRPSVWEDWIKTTKHNLLQKMTDEDKKFITIDDYDERAGYPISITLPFSNPSVLDLHQV